MSYIPRRLGRLLIAAALAGAAAGCGSLSKEVDPTADWSAEKLYADARDELQSGNFPQAIKQLQRLESRFPFGRWAQQAQLDIAYAHWRDGENAQALAAVDRFMRLHPDHPALDYALYLKGLVHFNENQGLFSRLGGQDLSERDLAGGREAFDQFRQLVARFPDSKYAPDAEARMRYLLNTMAAGEVHVARYYFNRGALLAAANRAQAVVQQYPTAPAVEDALRIMVRAYDQLGLATLRDDARRVLARNFPEGKAGERRDDALADAGAPVSKGRWWQFWR